MARMVIVLLVVILVVVGVVLWSNSQRSEPKSASAPSTGSVTRQYDNGQITITGKKDQVDKIDSNSVKILPPSHPDYPDPSKIGGGVKKVILVFQIKPKSSGTTIAPPRLTLDDLYVGQVWYDVTDKSQDLPIYRRDENTGSWNDVIGTARLKQDKAEHARGHVDHASLFAIVEEGEPVRPVTEVPPRTRDEVIREGVAMVAEVYGPQAVWILSDYGTDFFQEAAKLAITFYAEYGIEVLEMPIQDSRERLLVSIDAGDPPQALVLIAFSPQWEETMVIVEESGLAAPVFAYTEESGEPEWLVLKD